MDKSLHEINEVRGSVDSSMKEDDEFNFSSKKSKVKF